MNPPNSLMPVAAPTRVPARTAAEHASRQRLLNAYLRETGRTLTTTGDGLARITLPSSDGAIVCELRHRGVLGHHAYGEGCWLERPGVPRAPVDHTALVELLLDEVAAAAAEAFPDTLADPGRKAALAEQIDRSVEATAHYLRAEREQAGSFPHARTRHAEQSLRYGHPFHPTPKSTEGFGPDLARYSPELGATFVPHWWAVHPDFVLERRVTAAPWIPDAVERQARQLLDDGAADHALLPVHPWQASYLTRLPAVADLLTDGALVSLGPLGAPVYPTSSVRTVCDPEFPTSWKLPLHVRITNFVRTNPIPHLRRAADAGVLVEALRGGWPQDGFDVLIETGFRTVDPAVVGEDLAADFAVLFRDNPFVDGGTTPRVVAGLLEEPADGMPEVMHDVCRAAGSPGTIPSAPHIAEWLRQYLRISLVPLLEVFGTDGVSFEAHVQNSLLHTDNGRPTRFWIRDMEGVSVSRRRVAEGLVDDDSPVLYTVEEAWLRLRYHAVTNHLGHLVHVLARHGCVEEPVLWSAAAGVLAESDSEPAADLLDRPMLPAKANLVSRFAGRAETPRYVEIPNPLFGANR